MLEEVSTAPQSKFREETTPRWNQSSMYEYGFNGYCFSCTKFGHRAMDFKLYGRRSAGNQSDRMRCWTCDRIGHVAPNCHTLRCYTCGGVGHEAQACAGPRRDPMRRFSYPSTRKDNGSWKKNDTDRLEGQRTNDLSQGRSKVWVKKIDLLNMNEVDQCREDGFHLASQT